MSRPSIALAVAAAAIAVAPGAAAAPDPSVAPPTPPTWEGAASPEAAAEQAAPEHAPVEWVLQLEAGSEYDSNVHRVHRDGDADAAIDGSPLARLGARHRLTWRRGAPGERLNLSTQAGLKWFTRDGARSESVALLAAEGNYVWSLAGRGAAFGLTGSYYDAISIDSGGDDAYQGRAFRVGTGESRLTVGRRGHRLSAVAGYRAFDYKPDPDFDWRGEHIGVIYQTLRWRGDPDVDDDAASIELRAGYRVERRGYGGPARTSACPGDDSAMPMCVAPTALERADLNHSLAGEAIYTGARIYSARYELQYNDSNSLAESLIRQRLRLGFTTELTRELYLTVEATGLLHLYLDPLLVERDSQTLTYVSIDEENRNSLSVHLARALGPRWAIEGRYAIYSNEFTNQDLAFRRQTVYLGAVYRFDRRGR